MINNFIQEELQFAVEITIEEFFNDLKSENFFWNGNAYKIEGKSKLITITYIFDRPGKVTIEKKIFSDILHFGGKTTKYI